MTTIAFIDDEINILHSIKRLLRQRDWQLIFCVTPDDAVAELAGRKDIDIIVSDYRMPGMNGVELLGILKQSCPQALRIILSGHAELQGVLEAINQVEIYRFITKPWVDEEFVVTLEKAIQYQSLVQENLRLSDQVRHQQEKIKQQYHELRRLEVENPGLTRVNRTADGYIDLSSEFGEDL